MFNCFNNVRKKKCNWCDKEKEDSKKIICYCKYQNKYICKVCYDERYLKTTGIPFQNRFDLFGY